MSMFGTDGIRGRAGEDPISYEGALRVGVATAEIMELAGRTTLLAGDTRDNTGELMQGIADGITSSGGDVSVIDTIPTPGLALLTRDTDAEAGVMITASHNAYSRSDPRNRWNGIKIFGAKGDKVSNDTQEAIEVGYQSLLDGRLIPAAGRRGNTTNGSREELVSIYLAHLIGSIGGREIFAGQRVGLDTAHGATTGFAWRVVEALGADEIIAIGNDPDGFNINEGVGATHTEAISALVRSKNIDVAADFDGDGDRGFTVDRLGRIIDGDVAAYIGALTGRHNHIAVSVMANGGFVADLERRGVKVTRTSVGDRYLLEARREDPTITLGAEQSGHVIFDDEPSGDGMQTFLRTVAAVQAMRRPLEQLYDEADELMIPQALVSANVTDRSDAMAHPGLQAYISDVDERLQAAGGRSVFRASGTEEKLRLLVEAPKDRAELIQSAADGFTRRLQELGLVA